MSLHEFLAHFSRAKFDYNLYCVNPGQLEIIISNRKRFFPNTTANIIILFDTDLLISNTFLLHFEIV